MKLRYSITIGALAVCVALSGCVAEASRSATAPGEQAAAMGLREGVVVRVVDGDTARIVIGGTEEKVRFIGIDTPESTSEVEPYGDAASAYTRKELDGRTVWIETDDELRDRYGRLLAYIWLEPPASIADGEIRAKLFNARLLLDGYAQIYTFPPNVRYVEDFVRYQREARAANTGLWAVPGAADPLTGRRAE